MYGGQLREFQIDQWAKGLINFIHLFEVNIEIKISIYPLNNFTLEYSLILGGLFLS